MMRAIANFGPGYTPPAYNALRGPLLETAKAKVNRLLDVWRSEGKRTTGWILTGLGIWCLSSQTSGCIRRLKSQSHSQTGTMEQRRRRRRGRQSRPRRAATVMLVQCKQTQPKKH